MGPALRMSASSAVTRRAPQLTRDAEPGIAGSELWFLRRNRKSRLQQALTKRGYLHEAQSGALDDETSVGLRNFQADQKLARTGAPDRETLHRLGVSADKVFR